MKDKIQIAPNMPLAKKTHHAEAWCVFGLRCYDIQELKIVESEMNVV